MVPQHAVSPTSCSTLPDDRQHRAPRWRSTAPAEPNSEVLRAARATRNTAVHAARAAATTSASQDGEHPALIPSAQVDEEPRRCHVETEQQHRRHSRLQRRQHVVASELGRGERPGQERKQHQADDLADDRAGRRRAPSSRARPPEARPCRSGDRAVRGFVHDEEPGPWVGRHGHPPTARTTWSIASSSRWGPTGQGEHLVGCPRVVSGRSRVEIERWESVNWDRVEDHRFDPVPAEPASSVLARVSRCARCTGGTRDAQPVRSVRRGQIRHHEAAGVSSTAFARRASVKPPRRRNCTLPVPRRSCRSCGG